VSDKVFFIRCPLSGTIDVNLALLPTQILSEEISDEALSHVLRIYEEGIERRRRIEDKAAKLLTALSLLTVALSWLVRTEISLRDSEVGLLSYLPMVMVAPAFLSLVASWMHFWVALRKHDIATVPFVISDLDEQSLEKIRRAYVTDYNEALEKNNMYILRKQYHFKAGVDQIGAAALFISVLAALAFFGTLP